jgi:hypothetical protein
MNRIEELQRLALLIRTESTNWQSCIDWAIERLRNDDEGDDLDVVMLAASTDDDEASALVTTILERYLGPGSLTNEFAAGKLMVEFHALFQAGKESAISLEPKLWRLFYDLGQPTWLMMLARNCEYATDIPAFEKPFLDEFLYIANLWENANTEAEFKEKYDPKKSQSHDFIAQ